MTEERELKGRTVLMITVAAFGVVVAANMSLLYAALDSFPGLEVKNSYVASQSFDRERAAQEALGWNTAVAYDNGSLQLDIRESSGLMAEPALLVASIGRTTHTRDDQVLVLERKDDSRIAQLSLEPGLWLLRIDAETADGVAYSRRIPLTVPQRTE